MINNKNNQQCMFMTVIDTRFLSLCIKSAPVLSTCGKKKEENWSEWFLLKVYIVVCYFSLIIFSTVELTLFAMSFAHRELCSLLPVTSDMGCNCVQFPYADLGRNVSILKLRTGFYTRMFSAFRRTPFLKVIAICNCEKKILQ